MELAARNDWNIIYAPFAAAMVYGSLADAVRTYGGLCRQDFGRAPRPALCSYFIHIRDTPADEAFGRHALVPYFQDALLAALPSDPHETPPAHKDFIRNR